MRRAVAPALAALLVLTCASGASADDPDPFGDSQGVSGGGTATVTNTAGGTTTTTGSTGGGQGSGGSGPVLGVTYEKVIFQGPCVPDVPGNDPYLYVVYERPSGIAVANGCGDPPPGTPAAPAIDYADLRSTAMTVVASVTPDAPTVAVQPDGRALVNTPVVVHVGAPGGALTDSAVNPASGRTITVRLSAPTYRWDFGDGTSRSGGPGRRYGGGSVPREGSGNPYVSHTYGRTGAYTVSVTATYDVSYEIQGLGTFDLPDLPVTGRAAVQVVQARSELVRQ